MELYLDLIKGYLNTGKLVKRQVQVHGHNGKVFSRMQWVDPNTGQPVVEQSHGATDAHNDRINKLTNEQRHRITQSFTFHQDRASNFAAHTGFPRNTVPWTREHGIARDNHISRNLHLIPHEQLKPHLDEYDPQISNKKTTSPPRLGLEHTNHGLSEEDINHRHGRYGPLDMKALKNGVPMTENRSIRNWLADSKNSLDRHKYSKGKDIDPTEHFTNAFGSLSKEGIEHAFSIPEIGIKTVLDYAEVYMEKDGLVWNSLSLKMGDEETQKTVANMTRLVRRDEEGNLHIKNEFLEVKSKDQGQGIAEHIYARSEQLWRHLSGGHPIEIGVTANISVGTYAWAKKGFDFETDKDVKTARTDLQDFCDDNKIDTKDLLDRNGYKSVSDIKHPWDFAVLQNGEEWNLNKTIGGYDSSNSELKGYGHFGKAFMLSGMAYWSGIRRLNSDSIEEKIYDPLKKYRGKSDGSKNTSNN